MSRVSEETRSFEPLDQHSQGSPNEGNTTTEGLFNNKGERKG